MSAKKVGTADKSTVVIDLNNNPGWVFFGGAFIFCFATGFAVGTATTLGIGIIAGIAAFGVVLMLFGMQLDTQNRLNIE